MKENLIEVLAPAGSMDTLKAVVAAGADAIYLGGSKFGARAYAENFNEEEVLRGLDYAHLYGKQVYMTVNTLLREDELDALYDYLKPYYENGLDAVIVQDMGVLRYVREHFPKLPIHASTQMTIANVGSCHLLEQRGVSRIVTSREMTLEEIRQIHEQTNLEIESFVHGALCYSYSGQCLLSSMLGGRSGNRGRCAQPCRLGYQVIDENNQLKNEKQPYILSLKDMCTLDILPEILQAGVSSLKIEGRMKKAEYAASVVETYRKYVDRYLEYGTDSYHVSEQDRQKLMDIYNRGGFTQGYYKQKNGRNMVSLYKPNHVGVKVSGNIAQSKKGLQFQTIVDIDKDDVLQLEPKKIDGKPYTFSTGVNVKKGQMCPLPKEIRPGQWNLEYGIYRTRNNRLIERLHSDYADGCGKIAVHGMFYMGENEPLTLCVQCGEVQIQYTGAIAEKALNQPANEETIRKQLNKTGNTPFWWESLDIQMEGNPFIGMKELNACRREALEKLEWEMLAGYRRDDVMEKHEAEPECEVTRKDMSIHEKEVPILEKEMLQADGLVCIQETIQNNNLRISCIISTIEQLEQAITYEWLNEIYIESSLLSDKRLEELRERSHAEWKIAFPYIVRESTRGRLKQYQSLVAQYKMTGCLVRSLDGVYLAKEMGYVSIQADYGMYSFNSHVKMELRQLGVTQFITPVELNKKQLKHRDKADETICLYGYQPLMISANCVYKTCKGCMKYGQTGNKKKTNDKVNVINGLNGEDVSHTNITDNANSWILRDRYKAEFTVHRECAYCYNVIYNSKATMLLPEYDDILSMGYHNLQLHFTVEDAIKTKQMLDDMDQLVVHGKCPAYNMEQYTRGHFKRGVE